MKAFCKFMIGWSLFTLGAYYGWLVFFKATPAQVFNPPQIREPIVACEDCPRTRDDWFMLRKGETN